MIGLDTNVLVRYLTQDDPVQGAQAAAILEGEIGPENPGYVGLIVLAETVWVLTRAYHVSELEIARTVADLLQCRDLILENREAVRQALRVGGDEGRSFVDALIAADALHAGCDRIYTFDRRATRVGMTLCPS